jgi:hypothetical protein
MEKRKRKEAKRKDERDENYVGDPILAPLDGSTENRA